MALAPEHSSSQLSEISCSLSKAKPNNKNSSCWRWGEGRGSTQWALVTGPHTRGSATRQPGSGGPTPQRPAKSQPTEPRRWGNLSAEGRERRGLAQHHELVAVASGDPASQEQVLSHPLLGDCSRMVALKERPGDPEAMSRSPLPPITMTFKAVRHLIARWWWRL